MRGSCSPGDAACLCSSTIQSQTVPRVPPEENLTSSLTLPCCPSALLGLALLGRVKQGKQ